MALTHKDVERLFQVKPGRRFRLKRHRPDWAGGDEFKDFRKPELKERAIEVLKKNTADLAEAQERLYASDVYSVLIVLQAMDAAGKDGAIKHVMSGVNPQGCQVFAFKRPSDEEIDHTFLWRYMKCLPERGRIGIFNRSYYEDVLVVRVHPEILAHQKLPPGERNGRFWKARYDDINRFERHLTRNGTLILKFFLHLSKKEQKGRFLERLERTDKHWKFSFADLKEREHWDEYQEAFEEALQQTSTPWAPWWVIPADHKWVTRVLIASIITQAIKGLKLKMPALSAEQRRGLARAKRQLTAGKSHGRHGSHG